MSTGAIPTPSVEIAADRRPHQTGGSFVTRFVRRFAYPAKSPFLVLTIYYALLIGLGALLAWLVPDLREAFSGERLAQLAGQTLADREGVAAAPGQWLSWRFALMLGVAMIGAFLLMVPASWVYMATRRRKGFNQDMVQTMIVLALAVAGVVVIVRNSLALAFSLAGIVGAVRFRNSLPDPRDTLYIFLAVGVGLAAGVEALAAAAVFSIVFSYVVLAIWRTDYGMCELGRSASHLLHTRNGPSPDVGADRKRNGKGGKKPFNAVLVVRAAAADAARLTIEPFLTRETRRWELADVEHNRTAKESVLRYRVRLGKKVQPEAIEEALLAVGRRTLLGARIHG